MTEKQMRPQIVRDLEWDKHVVEQYAEAGIITEADLDEVRDDLRPTVEKALKRKAGRPRQYSVRQRTTLELSPELIAAIEQARGEKSKALFLEEVLRRVPEIAKELEHD